GDAHLERVGGRGAAHAVHAHPVLAHLLQVDGGEVGDGVRGDVALRVAHLVEELLLHRGRGDAAAGTLVLGDDEAAVGRRLDDGVADARKAGDAAPVDEAVAAGGLRAALVDVPRDDPAGDAVVVVPRPAEGVDDGRVGE